MTFAKLTARLAAAAVVVATASAASAQHWGTFKDNGCVRADTRAYSAVLWDIPWGASWEQACANMPATVRGHRFSHPTICTKASIADPIGYLGALTSIVGLAFPPAGVAGTIIGTSSLVMSEADVGALNMWGVFYVQDPRC